MMRIAVAVLLTALLAPAPIQISARSRSLQPGELVVLSIAGPEPSEPVRVRAFDRDVAAYPDGDHEWRALVGIDLDVKPGTYPVTVDAGSPPQHAVYDLVVAGRTFRTRRLTVDQAFVTPPASEAERIAREARLLDGAWKSPPGERRWSGPFVRPVPQPANSAFGTRSIFNGKPRNAHGGADFLSPSGTPVDAPNAGRVVIARDLYFSGNTVVIDHGLGLFSMLAHLSSIDVREDEIVAAGQVVGRVGATGRVTGPHLHWAVRASGARVDPLSLLTLLGEQSQHDDGGDEDGDHGGNGDGEYGGNRFR
jgi:murein DD-endopeptidase MepM/ murein hydrolase activator NlpD